MHIQHQIGRTLGVALLLGMAVLANGCASIVHGGSRTINLNSSPSGATATIRKADTGQAVHTGTTPLTVSLDPKRGFFKGQSYVVRFELDGYRSDEVVLTPQLSGWYFGNIVFGGLIGMLIVDPATGSMWNLSPEQLDRTLSANQAAVLSEGNGFIIALLSETTATERAQMVRIN